MSWLPDEYTRRARLAPAFLAVIPAIPAFSAIAARIGVALPTPASWPEIGGSTIALTSVAWWMLASQVGRAGRCRQPKLFASWGGAPLAAALRRSNQGPDSLSWQRIRAMLAQVTGTPELSEEAEAADAGAANCVCETYQAELRSLTRDVAQFPRVFEENCHYGFRRNLWGLKPPAIVIALTSLGVGCGLLADSNWKMAVAPASTGAIAISVLALGIWLFVVTQGWVRESAEAYVAAMLDAGLQLIRQRKATA